MPSDLVIILSVFGGVTLLSCALFLKFYFRRSRRAIQAVADWTGGRIRTNWSTGAASVSGKYDGAPFTCTYRPPHKGTPPYLILTLMAPQGMAFTIRRRNRFDRICRRLRLTRPIAVGAPDFDPHFHIDTAEPAAAAAILSDERFRHQVARFFEMPTTEVRFGRDGVTMKQELDLQERVYPESVIPLLDDLRTVSRPADRFLLRVTGAPLAGTALRLWLGAPLAVFLVAGLLLYIVGTEIYPPLYLSLWQAAKAATPVAAGLSAGYLLLAWLVSSRRTDRHITLGMVLLLALPGFYQISVGGLFVANGALDASPAVELTGTVYVTYTKGRGGKKIRFRVNGRITAGLDRPRGDFPRGLPVRLTVRDGYFGYPWVVDWRALKVTRGAPNSG